LLLKNMKPISFSSLLFGVHTSINYNKGWIFFKSFDTSWRWAMHFALNNEENDSNVKIDNKIMTIKHVWETGAVWILKEPNLSWIALDINSVMRLEPRIMNNTAQFPFECKETTLWSIFMYKHVKNGTEYTYPCFCGVIGPENWYNWYAMWLWNMQLCGSGHGLEYP
jgi:hypothetical protein